jgi:hypothetical protein
MEGCALTDPVAVLRRWEDFGAVWRVAARTGTTVTVSLCRCDDGEEVERFTSDDPQLIAYVEGKGESTP